MLNARKLKDGGYDMAGIESLCDRLLASIQNVSSPEAVVISVALENLRDEAADQAGDAA